MRHSSIPPNNTLSILSLEIFKRNGCFVSQYSKYSNQLQEIIQEHLQNGHIKQNGNGSFVILTSNVFCLECYNFENLAFHGRQKQVCARPNSICTVKQATNLPIELVRTTAPRNEISCEIIGTEYEMQNQGLEQHVLQEQDVFIGSNNYYIISLSVYICLSYLETPVFENHQVLKDVSNCSVYAHENQIENEVLNESIDEASTTDMTISQRRKEGS